MFPLCPVLRKQVLYMEIFLDQSSQRLSFQYLPDLVVAILLGSDWDMSGHTVLEFSYQAIQSAKANAVNTHEMNEAGLVISDLMINEGPRATRYRVRARGRICPIIKKTSHIIVGVKGA